MLEAVLTLLVGVLITLAIIAACGFFVAQEFAYMSVDRSRMAALADHTIVLDVYGAREDPIPGVSGALVSGAFDDASRVDFLPDWQAAADRVGEIAREGDLVMTLSCGDVYRIIPQLLDALEATDGDG